MAQSNTPRGPASSFRPYGLLIDRLGVLGLDVEALLVEAGIPTHVLNDFDTRVRRSQIDALWTVAIEATGDVLLPLRTAMDADAGTIGVISYLAQTSDTGRDAVVHASRFSELLQQDVDVDLAFEPGLAVLRLINYSSYQLSVADSQYSIGITVALNRALDFGVEVGPAVEARFKHSAPDHSDDYEAILGIPVRFEADHNSIAIPLEFFDVRFPKSDAVLRELLVQHASNLKAKIPQENSFADRVRNAAAKLLPTGRTGVDDVAKELNTSGRSVRRNLQAEGTSYRQVLDELRHALALRQLGPEHRGVDEVAYRLGFADASGFHKAFRRWTGHGPADYVKSYVEGDRRD